VLPSALIYKRSPPEHAAPFLATTNGTLSPSHNALYHRAYSAHTIPSFSARLELSTSSRQLLTYTTADISLRERGTVTFLYRLFLRRGWRGACRSRSPPRRVTYRHSADHGRNRYLLVRVSPYRQGIVGQNVA